MGETSRSQITITIGHTGQVVRRPALALDSSRSLHSEEAGSKRSVRDRLGSNGDSTQLSNKRLRLDNSRLNTSDVNAVDDVCLGRDDLRFKIMQKNALKQTQGNGNPNGHDLREILSRHARPSLSIQQQQQQRHQHQTDPRNGRLHLPDGSTVRHRLPEPDGVSQRMPEITGGSILGRVPLTRSVESLPQLVDLRSSSHSPWTLERLRQRSADGVLGNTSRGLSPRSREEVQTRPSVRDYDDSRMVPSRGTADGVLGTTSRGLSPRSREELQTRPLVRDYDDSRMVPSRGTDFIKVSRPIVATSLMGKPALPASQPQGSGVIQKSSYAVDGQHTVEGFLHSLGLEKYYIMFKAEEVDMTALRQMGDNDLKELGIPMGPRKKILLALLSRSKRII